MVRIIGTSKAEPFKENHQNTVAKMNRKPHWSKTPNRYTNNVNCLLIKNNTHATLPITFILFSFTILFMYLVCTWTFSPEFEIFNYFLLL